MVNDEQKSWADFQVVLQSLRIFINSEIQICGEASEVLSKSRFWNNSMRGVLYSMGLNIPSFGVKRALYGDFRYPIVQSLFI